MKYSTPHTQYVQRRQHAHHDKPTFHKLHAAARGSTCFRSCHGENRREKQRLPSNRSHALEAELVQGPLPLGLKPIGRPVVESLAQRGRNFRI